MTTQLIITVPIETQVVRKAGVSKCFSVMALCRSEAAVPEDHRFIEALIRMPRGVGVSGVSHSTKVMLRC